MLRQNYLFLEQVGLPITPMLKIIFPFFYSKNIPPKGSNYTHFSNSQFDLWYEKSFKVPEDERLQLYQKMDSLIMDELPIIPIYYDETIRFTQKNIEGFKNNPINLLQLKKREKAIIFPRQVAFVLLKKE
ncbi:hypothetical protein QIU19_12145 [Capnocytophaga canimorsus]|nr:hypothetical protein [Capnocytophaga canimorsus]WGU69566.1 hypothetical protein QIU19_12145 [Capnocytophaga canimorsus]